MDREYNIPKIEIPLIIPNDEADIPPRLNLLKLTQHKHYQALTDANDNKTIEPKLIGSILSANKITANEKLILLALYCAEVEDKFGLFEHSFFTKSQTSELIRLHELPFIRAKLAAIEILVKSDFRSNVASYLLRTSDLYLRSEFVLNALSTAREIKHYCGEDKYLNNIFNVIGTDTRGKRQKSQHFYMNRLFKNMTETGIKMIRSKKTDQKTFCETLSKFKIEVSSVLMSQIYSESMSASELSLEILTESNIISSPSAYWDQTKKNGSSQMKNVIDCLFAHKVTKEMLNDLTFPH